MSSILLDTHVFIWLVEDNPKLPQSVKERIEATDDIFVSIASFWEIGIKLKKQQIFLSCDFNEIESRFLDTDLQLLPISIQDTVQQYNLPFYLGEHKDPFDRIIISQAINRLLPLVSKDQAFDAYPIEMVWVLVYSALGLKWSNLVPNVQKSAQSIKEKRSSRRSLA